MKRRIALSIAAPANTAVIQIGNRVIRLHIVPDAETAGDTTMDAEQTETPMRSEWG